MTDIELVNKIKKGDHKAFEILFKRYKLSVTNIFVKNVYNKSDVDDLVMIVFSKVYRHINKYDNSNTFNSWITKISYNTLIDYFRRRKNIPTLLENTNDTKDYYIDNISINEETPEDILMRKQESLVLKEIIKGMKERERKILELRFFKEMRYEDIAKELKMPIGTIKAQIYRAKQLLNKEIKKNQKKYETLNDSFKK
jgi:RNA polymerase sigma-70 factor (ECF subfamily)